MVIEKALFVGDCRTCCDDSNFPWANDATELAQIVENSERVEVADFLNKCQVETKDTLKIALRLNWANNDNFTFSFGRYEDLFWMYDYDTDIHKFYF